MTTEQKSRKEPIEGVAKPLNTDERRKAVGGRAKVVEISLEELRHRVDTAFDLGVEQGLEVARRDLRDEIRDELEHEHLTPDCPMCIARRELLELRGQLARVSHKDRERARRLRNWGIQEGRYRANTSQPAKPSR